MTIYVNAEGKKFKEVSNLDDFVREDMNTDLCDAGLMYYLNGFQTFNYDESSHNAKDEFLTHLFKLPIKLQSKLNNEIMIEDGTWWENHIDYYQNYLDFLNEVGYDYEDLEANDLTPQEMQEEYLASLKERESESYVPIESPMRDFESRLDDYRFLEIALDFLEENISNFKWWYVTGPSQGDLAYVWTWDTSNENFKWLKDTADTFAHSLPNLTYTFDNYLSTIMFGSFVTIQDCDDKGNVLEDSDYSIVADLYLDDTSNPYYSDEYVNKYMKDTYAMNPAEVVVSYQ